MTSFADVPKMFPTWKFVMGFHAAEIGPVIMFVDGVEMRQLSMLQFIIARRGEHQVCVVSVKGDRLLLESLVELLRACEAPTA